MFSLMAQPAKSEMNISNECDAFESDDDFIFVESAIHEFDNDGEALPGRKTAEFSWSAIESACKRLLDKGRDIRVVIWWIRAAVALGSLNSLRTATAQLAECVGAPPAELRPYAPDAASPIELHALHLAWLGSDEFLHQLGNLHPPTLSATLIGFSRNKSAAHPDYPDARRLDRELEQIATNFTQAAETLEQRGATFDVDAVVRLLGSVRSALNRNAAAAPHAGALSGEPLAIGTLTAESHQAEQLPATIVSRQEVADALERVSSYFRQYEPGHPALLFLSRVQRLLGASFEEILTELYVDGQALAAQLGRPGSVSK